MTITDYHSHLTSAEHPEAATRASTGWRIFSPSLGSGEQGKRLPR